MPPARDPTRPTAEETSPEHGRPDPLDLDPRRTGDWAAIQAYIHILSVGNARRCSIDADELESDIQNKIVKNAPSFDPSQGSFRAWCGTIANNAALDALRRIRRHLSHLKILKSLVEQIGSSTDNDDASIAVVETGGRLTNAQLATFEQFRGQSPLVAVVVAAMARFHKSLPAELWCEWLNDIGILSTFPEDQIAASDDPQGATLRFFAAEMKIPQAGIARWWNEQLAVATVWAQDLKRRREKNANDLEAIRAHYLGGTDAASEGAPLPPSAVSRVKEFHDDKPRAAVVVFALSRAYEDLPFNLWTAWLQQEGIDSEFPPDSVMDAADPHRAMLAYLADVFGIQPDGVRRTYDRGLAALLKGRARRESIP